MYLAMPSPARNAPNTPAPSNSYTVVPLEESNRRPMDALNEAVADLVDSLFNVIDKVQDARRYLKQLDDLTDAALDYLSAIGVPQLDQED